MLRILYVEDNAANLSLVHRVARLGGHEVVNRTSGEAALKDFDKIRPDLVLMDIQLEGAMNGLEVVQQLRASGHTLPIIAVTAYAMKGDRERAIEAGCNDYLPKPLPIKELVSMLDQYHATTQQRKTGELSAVTAPSEPAAPVSETPASSEPAAPVSEAPAPSEPAAPVSEAPAPSEPAAPVSETPAPSEPAAPVSETPAPSEPAAPVSEAPAPSEPAAPVSETPASSEPAAPVSETPAPSEPAAPASETPAPEPAPAVTVDEPTPKSQKEGE